MSDTVTIPQTSEELEELLNDPERVAAVFGDDEARLEFITAYARKVVNSDRGIEQQVREQTQQVIAEMLRDNPDVSIGRPPVASMEPTPGTAADRRRGLFNKRAPGAKLDALNLDMVDFVKATWHRAEVTADVAELRGKLRNALSSEDPAAGGFLIPETLRSELLMLALEQAIVRPRARVIPMESDRVPFPTLDVTSHASSVFGGIIAYWTAEAAALTASDPKFGRTVLDANKLTAYTEVPNELMTDSAITMTALIDQLYPAAIAWFEDNAFLTGTGAGEPLGALNAAAAVSVAKETGQPAATIVWENIVKAYARMLPSALGSAVWVASIDTFPELATMALSVGTGGSAIWLNSGTEGPPMSILGRPVIFTEKASVLGTVGDINFIDFGHYLIGDRMAMSLESSTHYKFGNDVTAFRVIERVDGRPWLNSAVTPKNSGPTLSPFVKIATRA